MTGVRIGRGVLRASGLIGPLVALPALMGPIVPGVDDIGTLLGGIGAVLLLSAAVGFFLAIFPNLAGAALLGWLGDRHRLARSPVIWASTGALMAAPLGLCAGPNARGSLGGSVLSFAVIGLVSALICRSGVSWPDGKTVLPG